MRSLKSGLVALVLSASTLLSTPTKAEEVWNDDGSAGIYVDNIITDGEVDIIVSSKNIYDGVTYDSLEVFYSAVFDQIYRDTQTYGTFSGTKEEFMDQIGFGITGSSEIKKGWTVSKNGNGELQWVHEDGWANFDYDEFTNIHDDPNQDTADTGFGIPWQFCDWNKNGVFDTDEGDGIKIGNVDSYKIYEGYFRGFFIPSYITNAPVARYIPSYTISVTDADNGSSSPKNAVVLQGGSTNITFTADQYYYLDNTVHDFGTSSITNTYGEGSNTVVETFNNVGADINVQPTFKPYLTQDENVPEWWLAQYFGDTNNFNNLVYQDNDGDGLPNYREYQLNKNPNVRDYSQPVGRIRFFRK